MLSNAKPEGRAETAILPDDRDEGVIDPGRIAGRLQVQNVKASSMKKVGEIVEKHPDEALSVIRNWLHQVT